MRGTSRTTAGVTAIEAAGLDASEADPDRLGTVLDLIGDVTVVGWLMGSAQDEWVNGERLESLMIRLVDTPVRGFVYEAVGSAPAAALARGREIVADAGERWRIPVAALETDPSDSSWSATATRAVTSLTG